MDETESRPAAHSTSWDPASLPDDDAQVQALVLNLLLVEHPRALTFAETVRALAAEDGSQTDIDAVARAVSDLVSYGLLNRAGEHLFPSRAALRFDELPLP